MQFTFGICTAYEDVMRLEEVIHSIELLHIPTYEIIIAGSFPNHLENIPHFNHRALLTDGWITKKKNMIASAANYENLVLLHDYFLFDSQWYQEYVKFGNDWDVCSNPQLLIDGTRHFTDWVTWDHPDYGQYYSLPYGDWSHTKFQYISGGFFCIKRDFLRQHSFDETMKPGEPEDVEFSLRIRDKAVIVCNSGSIVRHNKVHRDCKNKR